MSRWTYVSFGRLTAESIAAADGRHGDTASFYGACLAAPYGRLPGREN